VTLQFLEQIVDGAAKPARSETATAQRFVDGSDPADFEQPALLVMMIVGQDFELRLDHLEVAR
jgi:hypothetical protein